MSHHPSESSDEESYGPCLPRRKQPEEAQVAPRIIGPALPSLFKPEENTQESDDEDLFGPALPPHLLKKKNDEHNIYEIPKQIEISDTEEKDKQGCDDASDDDDDMIGPLPAGCASASNSFAQQKLEERAWRIKNDFLKKPENVEKKREEWMLELPPAHTVASLSLGPRKFRTREGPDMSDRSSWTDTPADREKKRIERMNKATFEKPHKNKRKYSDSDEDRRQKKSKKKEKSLLELHQDKLKKEKKKAEKEAKESGKILRRPFDRDIDLKIGGINPKDKKSMLAKSQLLDDRFCHGKM